MLTNNLKRKRIGLIVWGAIVSGFALSCIISAILSSVNLTGLVVIVILYLCLLAGGIAMLVGGIINVSRVSQYNQQVLAEENRYYYAGVCPHCQHPVSCGFSSFSPHRRYPEGFIYCPYCKRPISKNLFQKYLK